MQSQAGSAISLRVLRLCRPVLTPHSRGDIVPVPENAEILDVPGLGKHFATEAEKSPAGDHSAPEGHISLPRSFGSTYLGQVFSCYVTVRAPGISAESPPLTEVSLRVELQTPTSKRVVIDTASDKSRPNILGRKDCLDLVASEDVKEMGLHVLTCMANYRSPLGERKQLKKFFKFTVTNPLSVRTRQSALGDASLVEVQVQNVTQSVMSIERVKFGPGPGWTARDLASGVSSLSETLASGEDDAAVDVYDGNPYLGPGEVRQHLWEVIPDSAGSGEKRGDTLGKMEIVWKSTMGEPGRLQTNPVIRKAPQPPAQPQGQPQNQPQQQTQLQQQQAQSNSVISSSVMSLITIGRAVHPSRVTLEQPFDISVELFNGTDVPVTLRLRHDGGDGGLVLLTPPGRVLPSLPPRAPTTITLSAMALEEGVLNIQGIGFEGVGRTWTLAPTTVFSHR